VVASAFGYGVDGVLGVHFWFIGGVGGVYKSGVGVTLGGYKGSGGVVMVAAYSGFQVFVLLV